MSGVQLEFENKILSLQDDIKNKNHTLENLNDEIVN